MQEYSTERLLTYYQPLAVIPDQIRPRKTVTKRSVCFIAKEFKGFLQFDVFFHKSYSIDLMQLNMSCSFKHGIDG